MGKIDWEERWDREELGIERHPQKLQIDASDSLAADVDTSPPAEDTAGDDDADGS